MANFCSHCGQSLAPEAKFCPGCGAPVAETKAGDTFAAEADAFENYSNVRNDSHENVYVPDKGIKEMFFRYDNRLNRWPYFCRSIIVSIVICILSKLIGNAHPVIMAYISLVMTLPLLIRRWHDLGKSGWWVLVAYVPIANFFAGLYLLFAKGDEGPNEYGPDPLGRR